MLHVKIHVLLVVNVCMCLSVFSMLHELWSWRSKPLINTYFHGVYELSMGEREVIRGNYIFVYTVMLQIFAWNKIMRFAKLCAAAFIKLQNFNIYIIFQITHI